MANRHQICNEMGSKDSRKAHKPLSLKTPINNGCQNGCLCKHEVTRVSRHQSSGYYKIFFNSKGMSWDSFPLSNFQISPSE